MLHRLSLINLLATALGALVMLAADIGEPTVWRPISGVGLLVTLYFASRSIWPVLLLLVALFAIGCYSFVRLVFADA